MNIDLIIAERESVSNLGTIYALKNVEIIISIAQFTV